MNYLDKLKLHPYISENVSLEIYEKPFKYIIIDNLFKQEIYDKICKKFPELIAKRNRPHGQVGSNPNNIYEAIIYGLMPEDCVEGLEFFVDPFWKKYLSDLFDVILNQHTAYSAHFHKGSKENPSKSGWIHKDLSICSAIDEPNKEIKIVNDCDYSDDTTNFPNTTKIIRSVVHLYYLNNIDNLTEEDGGGTGVYSSYDHKDLVKVITPVNNRLFSFEITPLSFHAYIGAKFNRSALVQWFHSNPSYYVHKHFGLFKKQFLESKFLFERWKKENPWKLSQDQEYSKYFDRPLKEILLN